MSARYPRVGFVVAALAVLLGACDDDLPKATEIARMRLLGARVEVEGDPTRATPRPGETANVHFVAVHPTLAANNDTVQTILASCTQPDRYTGGVPVCQEFLDAALLGEDALLQALGSTFPPDVDVASLLGEVVEGCAAVGTGVVKVDTQTEDLGIVSIPCVDGVPNLAQSCDAIGPGVLENGTVSIRCAWGEPDVSLSVAPTFTAEKMLYLGTVCQEGDAILDPLDPMLVRCDDNDGETFRVHGTVTVQYEPADENHNPSFADGELYLGNPGEEGGREWLPLDPADFPAEDDCWDDAEAAGMLRADSFGNHQITIRWDPDAREMVDGEPEDVELSFFATTGELEQRFVLFDELDEPEDGMFVDTVTWTPPTELESRSQIVRFFFTVLDRRGGFDWTSRALCLR